MFVAVGLFHQFSHKWEEMKQEQAGGSIPDTSGVAAFPVWCRSGASLKKKQTVTKCKYLIRSKSRLLVQSRILNSNEQILDNSGAFLSIIWVNFLRKKEG